MRSMTILTCICALTTAVAAFTCPAEAADPVDTLRVMSFNVRFGSAKDGENSWDHRKEFLVETIQKFNPDLLGTQETEKSQKDYLEQQLTGYTSFAAGRDDGADKGEMMAIYYRADRFSKLDGGHFWLSETPDVTGSKSWDSSLPRMVSWLKLQDNSQSTKPVIWYFNTHFDHRGPQARAESARLIHDRLAKLPENSVFIVTGDFNAGEDSQPYKNLFTPENPHPLLLDSYRQVHPQRTNEEVTYNSFKPDAREGGRIDWIGISRNLQTVSVEINHVSRNGRVPSDHFPIEAVFKYKK